MTAKDELRRQIRARRASVSAAVRAEVSAAICRNLLARDDVRRAMSAKNLVAVYLASADEIDLSPLLAALTAAEVPLAAPRWDGTTYALARLRRQHTDANGQPVFALREGPHRILEPMDDDRVAPAEVAIWIVPGLAFAVDGRRLGYGGGWYDRFLSAAAPDARKLGVAYPFQLFADLPTEPHDCVLSDVVMP